MTTSTSTNTPATDNGTPMLTKLEVQRMSDVDLETENPREEMENVGTMVCFHGKYRLGDRDHGIDPAEFDGWDDVEKFFREEMGAAVVLPVYMIDHGGVAVSTEPYGDPWDSGQVGFIFATMEKIQEAIPLSDDPLGAAENILYNEVVTYSSYLQGDVWEWVVRSNQTGEILDSCGGFYHEEDAQEDGEANWMEWETHERKMVTEAASAMALRTSLGALKEVVLRAQANAEALQQNAKFSCDPFKHPQTVEIDAVVWAKLLEDIRRL
tara:strand:+ start:3554 stop:4354 length:801 start_codon:yes stop_codon:yes gene_type:complete